MPPSAGRGTSHAGGAKEDLREGIYVSDLAARCARALRRLSLKKREQGMPDARCTRGLVCKIVQRSAHEHTGSAEAIRHSLRNGFTAYAVLSPATNSSCHRHRRIEGFVTPGWANQTSADLTPATGARTTRFCRTRFRLRQRLLRDKPVETSSTGGKQRRSSCAVVDRSQIFRPALQSRFRARRCRVHRIPSQRS
jgi:hypothetical protein